MKPSIMFALFALLAILLSSIYIVLRKVVIDSK